jgi:hypothetical protein
MLAGHIRSTRDCFLWFLGGEIFLFFFDTIQCTVYEGDEDTEAGQLAWPPRCNIIDTNIYTYINPRAGQLQQRMRPPAATAPGEKKNQQPFLRQTSPTAQPVHVSCITSPTRPNPPNVTGPLLLHNIPTPLPRHSNRAVVRVCWGGRAGVRWW